MLKKTNLTTMERGLGPSLVNEYEPREAVENASHPDPLDIYFHRKEKLNFEKNQTLVLQSEMKKWQRNH